MKRCALLVSLFVLLAFSAFGQTQESLPPKAEQIDEFGRVGECTFRGRVDGLLAMLAENPSHRGVIIVYPGLDQLPGERLNLKPAFVNHILFRKFDQSRITIVQGSLQEKYVAELFAVPAGAEMPQSRAAIKEPKTDPKQSVFYDRGYLEDGAGATETLWNAKYKSQQEQEELALQAELAAEGGTNGITSEIEPADDVTETASPITIPTAFLDAAAKTQGAFAVVVFYADDEIYDIGLVRQEIRMQWDKAASEHNKQNIPLNVIYGGYRNFSTVEYWIRPAGATVEPTIKPDERPVDQDEEDTEN